MPLHVNLMYVNILYCGSICICNFCSHFTDIVLTSTTVAINSSIPITYNSYFMSCSWQLVSVAITMLIPISLLPLNSTISLQIPLFSFILLDLSFIFLFSGCPVEIEMLQTFLHWGWPKICNFYGYRNILDVYCISYYCMVGLFLYPLQQSCKGMYNGLPWSTACLSLDCLWKQHCDCVISRNVHVFFD